MAGARTPRTGVTNDPPCSPLSTCRQFPARLAIARRKLLAQSNSGNGNLRPETLGAAGRERSPERAKPTAETISPRTGYGNGGLFLTLGTHVGLRRLPGGAEGIRTCDPPRFGHQRAFDGVVASDGAWRFCSVAPVPALALSTEAPTHRRLRRRRRWPDEFRTWTTQRPAVAIFQGATAKF